MFEEPWKILVLIMCFSSMQSEFMRLRWHVFRSVLPRPHSLLYFAQTFLLELDFALMKNKADPRMKSRGLFYP